MSICAENITWKVGKKVIVNDVSLKVSRGETVGLLGPNGCGKSSLLRILAGLRRPDAGCVTLDGQDISRIAKKQLARRVAFVEQHGMTDANMRVRDVVKLGRIPHHSAFSNWSTHDDETVTAALQRVDMLDKSDQGWLSLSGGERQRVHIARALAQTPTEILLDEPTNHLDIESIIWLERFLKSRNSALLMTSHDREFMNRIVTKIAEIDSGEITVFSGNYDFYERECAIRDNNREAAFARQEARLAKERRFIDRFSAHAAKAAQVQSRIKALDKIEKIELPQKRKAVRFDFRTPPRSGDIVVTIENVSKSYGQRVIYDNLEMIIRRGERWAVMGRNGAGKTTLLKMVAGVLDPDSGTIRLGASLKMGYFAQASLDILDPNLSIEEQLQKDFPKETIGTLRNLAGAFQFSGKDVEKKIAALSGGEKTRLALARMLLDPPNFLVLDEPTNHLDVSTKEMLVEALKNFEGTMLFVSHDRTFLRGLSNRVLELGGNSGTDFRPHLYPGSYSEYVEQSGHEAPGVRS